VGHPWPTDYGPELSRGFRALKVWAHLLEHGTEALGATISANIELAGYLAGLVDRCDINSSKIQNSRIKPKKRRVRVGTCSSRGNLQANIYIHVYTYTYIYIYIYMFVCVYIYI